MVCEILSPGAYLLPLVWAFIEEQLRDHHGETSDKAWGIIEASSRSLVYLPGLSRPLREASSRAKLFWIHCEESEAPLVTQKILESSLCAGVLLRGLERFASNSPAALWGRRWQLAAERGGAHLFWQHESKKPLLGFDLRLEWDEFRGCATIKKQNFGRHGPELWKGSLTDYGKKLYQEDIKRKQQFSKRPAA